MLMASSVAVNATDIQTGFSVNYKGKDIAVIESISVFNAAKEKAAGFVEGADVEDIGIEQPVYRIITASDEGFTDEDELARLLLDRSANVVCASVLYVNGEEIACVSDMDVEQYLEQRLSEYKLDGAQCQTSFVDTVSIEDRYLLKENVSSNEKAKQIIDSLAVKTVSTVKTQVEVKFSTVTEKTSSKPAGYSAVKSAGINGVNLVTEEVICVNGEEVRRNHISTEVVSNPVNEVVLVGTAKASSYSQNSAFYNLGFVFPLPKSSYIVSAYYGDGRNHKGIDLAADAGTSIYAVKAGTVTYSGWDGDYGYSVIIDHGNGIVTRYAHASKLLCSVGETVSAGQTIALVGTTGMSTGNHLHFEVSINSKKVNPAPYIGL